MTRPMVFMLFIFYLPICQQSYSLDHPLEQLTFSDSTHDGYPYWSPDGSMILFTSDHGGNADLWIMSIDGGDPVQITNYADEGSNPGYDIEASWSLDGEKITFSSTRTGYWAIWVMEPDMDIIRSKFKK